MIEENTLSTEEAIDQEIVAYLDGELDPAAAARVERQMAENPRYSARLNQLQKAWDLLDTLGPSEADDNFTHSTVAMVALKAQDEVQGKDEAASRRQRLTWAALAGLAMAAAIGAYVVVDRQLNSENRELVRDLPVIERVDEYRNVESVEFLQELQKEGLFAAEVDHGQ
ncbi:MAG TPA: zf-HC2 domain-containing protein [Pirellulaceae bacterium]|nr:zf-HC2 domain-containing protein [Pirellulaceae bacterium]